MATLEDKAVNEILMSERSVVAYFPELEKYFDVAETEIKQIIKSFFDTHSVNGKISFTVLRRKLTSQELKAFKAQLEVWQVDWQEDAGWEPFMTASKNLISRKAIMYREQVIMQLRHALEEAFLRVRNSFNVLARNNLMAAYYLKAFDTAKLHKTGIKFTPITLEQLNNTVNARWQEARFYGNFNDRSRNRLDTLLHEIDVLLPQAIAAANSTAATLARLLKQIQTAENYEKANVRTEINRIVNAADLLLYNSMEVDSYRYVAILDMVTTEICRSLHGQVFRVSQAQTNVNFPPMHVNCRSTTEPVLEKYEAREDLLTLLRSYKLEDFVREYAEESMVDEILNFLKKYNKGTFTS